MDILHVPIGRSAVKRARQEFYSSWHPHGGPLTDSLRVVRRNVLRRLRLPVSFANLTDLWVAANEVRNRFGDLSAPDHTLSVFELAAIRRLEAVLVEATLRYTGASQPVSFRKDLERDLARLFPTLSPPQDAPVFSMPDVLCVVDTRLITGSGFMCYINSCIVSPPQKVVSHRVVCLPRWVYALFAALCQAPPPSRGFIGIGKQSSFLPPDAVDTAFDTFMAVSTTNISACSEIPAPEVLEAALALWSPVRDDLYHDVNHAVVAAQRLN